MPPSRFAVVLLAVLGPVSLGCASDNPVDPEESCRNFPGAFTFVQTSAGLTQTANMTCTFTQSPTRLTCSGTFTTSNGFTGNTTDTINYNSTADFVAETAVVPPRIKHVSQQTVTAGTVSSNTVSYDAQGRPVQQIGSGSGTIIYTNWDNSQRPTAATVTSNGVTSARTIAYNDSTRTQTFTDVAPGFQTNSVVTYDANGNHLSTTVNSPVGTLTSSTTMASTTRFCR